MLVTIAALGDLDAARLNLSCHSRMRKTLMPIKAARVTCGRQGGPVVAQLHTVLANARLTSR